MKVCSSKRKNAEKMKISLNERKVMRKSGGGRLDEKEYRDRVNEDKKSACKIIFNLKSRQKISKK